MEKSDIVIFTASDGHIQLEVNIVNDTLWLNQQQIADLFGVKRQAITKHLKNIFISKELDEDSVCSILEHTAEDGKRYKTKFYTLDAIISVGYRVNSLKATEFRVWATGVLKEHLIQGYTVHKPRLAQKGLKELHQAIELLQKTLVHNELINDIGAETIQIILSHANTWSLLLAYDEDRLTFPEQGKEIKVEFGYNVALDAIAKLKIDLASRGEASELFGFEREHGLESILNNLALTFGGELLYKTVEERAAHLFYFVIKDHPLVDGNKRVGSFLFLLYLRVQNVTISLNEKGLVALALLIAESAPSQKDIMIRLIANLFS